MMYEFCSKNALYSVNLFSKYIFAFIPNFNGAILSKQNVAKSVGGLWGKDIEGDWTYWGGVYRRKGPNLLHTITDLKFHLNLTH